MYQLSDGNDIITNDDINPKLSSPDAAYDLYFMQTRETLSDPERYKSFLKNAERRFRACPEYKQYKNYLMSMGFTHCQVMGNIEADENTDIELHHNVLGLFDICILICEHVLNTTGRITTYDLIQLLILEHQQNHVGITMLSTTIHQMYTGDPDGYIPPEMTFGQWWVLLSKYKYGITYEIAQKVIKYLSKYQNQMPISIRPEMQEQLVNFAYYNQFGIPADQIKIVPNSYKRIESEEGDWQ